MGDGEARGRDAFLAFELALDEQVFDEVRETSWGRILLTPSLPLLWDANLVDITAEGLGLAEVMVIADEALGEAGLPHRVVCLLDEAEGRRLGSELEVDPGRWPGWEVERTRYMEWRGGAAPSAGDARETVFAEVEELRRELLAEEMKADGGERSAVLEQLLDLDRRYGEVTGDRWFVAPAEGRPVSACRLYRAGGIAQVEDVGTLRDSRERGHAKAIVLAAVAAAQKAEDRAIFLTADAADWPQLMYAKLGFEEVGEIVVLRRRP